VRRRKRRRYGASAAQPIRHQGALFFARPFAGDDHGIARQERIEIRQAMVGQQAQA